MNVAANKGVYALLLGSGVSRSAGIPTGWEIVLDLVRKVAAAAGSDTATDPEEWYREEHRSPPQYSTLLEELGPTADERRSRLEGYFEPTADEREAGVKTPTDAHRAIARMVADGWIRVIVTTNFDRLLEVALEEAGVTPVVIATPEAAAGATPLAHSKCTVIKVHGDYMDPGIKNSEEELATYDPATNTLLDQVFDEYGLVVCGWSGEYDVALRAALRRSNSKRYTTYWCSHGELSLPAQQLIADRGGQVIPIEGADAFFERLESRVPGTSEDGEQAPTDSRATVKRLERYLTDDGHRIRLRKLVSEVTEELVSHLNEDNFSVSVQRTDEEIASRVQRLDRLAEQTIALLANGCFWGSSEQDEAWVGVIRRLAEFEARNPAANRWGNMFRYPALLALYAAGVGSVATGRYQLLASVLLSPTRSPHGSESQPLVESLYPYEVLPDGAAQLLLPAMSHGQKHFVPRNQYLHLALRPVFANLIPSDNDYDDAFDRFEYLVSLVEADLNAQSGSAFPTHRWFDRRARGFTWRRSGLAERMRKEIDQADQAWPPLQAGLFGGSVERFLTAKGAVDKDNSEHLA